MERREVEALVEAGCPVVTYLPGGRVVWHDEDDAWPAWADARSARTDEMRDARGGEPVTAGRWVSSDGASVVVLIWHR